MGTVRTAGRTRLTLWAIGGLTNAIELGVSFGYLLFFLTQVLLVPPALAGSILFAARMWDVLTDPLMGWLTDRARRRVERRAWVLAGSLLLALLFPLMFLVPPELPLTTRAGLFAAAYILANTASTIFAIPHVSLVTVVASPEGRSRAMGWYLTWVRIGLLLVGLGAPLAFNLSPELRPAFIAIGIGSGLVAFLVGLTVFLSIGKEDTGPVAAGSATPWHSVIGALRCPPIRTLALLQIVKNAAVGCAASVLAFFITIVLRGPIELVGIMGTVAGGLAALFTPFWVLVAGQVDIRRVMIMGLIMTACCLASYLLLAPDRPNLSATLPFTGVAIAGGVIAYVVLALLNTVGDSAVNYAPSAMIPDANEWRRQATGRDDAGSSFALFSLTGKLGFAAGGLLSSLTLDGFGFVAGNTEQSEQTMLGIRLAAGGVPALLLLACIPLILAFPARRDLLAGMPLGRGRLAGQA